MKVHLNQLKHLQVQLRLLPQQEVTKNSKN